MTVRFGDFELDTMGCRLTRKGEDVRLAKQPMDLLIFLAARSGQLVTRDEITTALWGDSLAGAEHSLNTAMRRVRVALGDDPESPKYIETVPRRGYRFIAAVTAVAATEPEAVPPRRIRIRLPLLVAALALLVAGIVYAVVRTVGEPSDRPPELSWRPVTKPILPDGGIASDGKSVFWTEDGESGPRPWQAPLNGSMNATPVRVPFPAFVLDATSEGQLLLAARGNCSGIAEHGCEAPLFELSVGSGQIRRLGDIEALNAAYSPDGLHVAFTRFNEIWLVNRDGSEPRRIAAFSRVARGGGIIDPIHWSPDGRSLRFTVHNSSELSNPLWEAALESGKIQMVAPEWREKAEPLGGVWTRDRGFIFGVERLTGIDLWRVNSPGWPSAHTHKFQQLTRGPLDFFGPAAIPGRSELAVIGARKRGELVRFDSRAGKFLPFLKGISAEMADFSRDGKWVTYVTYPERDLWRSRVDGSEALQLTRAPLNAGVPRISPDGRQIAFTGDYSNRQMGTWLVLFDGGDPRPATRLEEGTAEVAPTWSPDGTQLLYRFDRKGQHNVLRILDLHTGSVENVPGSEDRFNQRWSPDGKWIAATPNDENGLFLFSTERREWRQLTAMRADYPSWSGDSGFVYYCTRLENDEEAIYRVGVASGKPERVASLSGTPRAIDEVYTQWAGLTPDGSPLVLRSADLRQIYLLSFAAR